MPLEGFDGLEIDDVGTMDSHERLRAQPCRQILYRDVHDVRPIGRVQRDVVAAGFAMQDLLDRDRDDPPAHAGVDPTERIACGGRRVPLPYGARVAGGQRGPNPFERLLETLGTERLQQVVQRLDLERRYGVLVERGRENHLWVMREAPEHLEAVALRHLDV